MAEEDRIPQDLINAIMHARQVHQLDENYSNGPEPWSPTWEHLLELMQGVEDDPTVQYLIQHYKQMGWFPDK